MISVAAKFFYVFGIARRSPVLHVLAFLTRGNDENLKMEHKNMHPCESYSIGSHKLANFLAGFFALPENERICWSAEFKAAFLEAAILTVSCAEMLSMRKDWASESYVHANGFTKIVVFVTLCGNFRLRVHSWPKGSSIENLNVHNHRFDFASYVLKGAVDDVTWLPAECGDVFRRFLYTSRNALGSYRHEYIDQQVLRLDAVRRFVSGQLYSLNREKLHYTLPSQSSLTVTFFAEDRRNLRTSAMTYSRHHAIDEVDTFTPSLTYDVYQKILQEQICSAAGST